MARALAVSLQSVASSSRDRIEKLGRVLESRQSKMVEEEMTRRLHSDSSCVKIRCQDTTSED
jgi:hypothetical protein